MKNIYVALTCMMMLGLFGCHDKAKQTKDKIITVEKSPVSTNLFYAGTIAPITTRVIPSPADGAVIEMPVQYGAFVQKGDLLFKVSSSKFLTDYKSALMQYVKAKSEYNTSQSQMTEAKFLHTNQLISDDDFKMKKASYYSARLTLLQAKDALDVLLHQADQKNKQIYNLDIADVDKITKAMHLKQDSENITIIAPGDGILLSSKSDDDSKKINKGDAIKQGDVLAVIGDMGGLSIRIKVNELIVNQLKIGQKVKVSGIAFPEYTLAGKIYRIDHQAEVSSGALPNFTVEIIVPKLNEKQQRTIHVGMSANVEIMVEEEPKVLIPIKAVAERNGTTLIKVLENTKTVLREVKTGKTTPDAVAILEGVQPGEKIVVPD